MVILCVCCGVAYYAPCIVVRVMTGAQLGLAFGCAYQHAACQPACMLCSRAAGCKSLHGLSSSQTYTHLHAHVILPAALSAPPFFVRTCVCLSSHQKVLMFFCHHV